MPTRHQPLVLAVVAALLQPAAAQRLLHWVIRVSSLEDTVGFATEVLGMKVLRHEENAEPCPLTCNGVFDTPWSKTMVGYGPEDGSYALELTFVGGPEEGPDAAHIFVTERTQLEAKLVTLRDHMARDGHVWVSWPKQAAKLPTDITEDTIREVALPLGLVDTKVCAVDEVWSGLKLVIRKELR